MQYKTSTIANSATAGSTVNLEQSTVVGVALDSGFDGTSLTFEVSLDEGTTWIPLHNEGGGGAYTITVGTSICVPVQLSVFCGIQYIRPKAGTAQTGSTVVTFITRAVA